MRTIFVSLLLGALLAHASCATAQDPSPLGPSNAPPMATITSDPPMTQDASCIYERLAAYGQRFWLDPYGWAWTPNNGDVGWRPYTEGNWV